MATQVRHFQVGTESKEQCSAKLDVVRGFMNMLTYITLTGHAERAVHLIRRKYQGRQPASAFQYTHTQLLEFRAQYGKLYPVYEALVQSLQALKPTAVQGQSQPGQSSHRQAYHPFQAVDIQRHVNDYHGYVKHVQIGTCQEYNIFIPDGQKIGTDWPNPLPLGAISWIPASYLEVSRKRAEESIRELIHIAAFYRAVANAQQLHCYPQCQSDRRAKAKAIKSVKPSKGITEAAQELERLRDNLIGRSPTDELLGQLEYDSRQWCKVRFKDSYFEDLN